MQLFFLCSLSGALLVTLNSLLLRRDLMALLSFPRSSSVLTFSVSLHYSSLTLVQSVLISGSFDRPCYRCCFPRILPLVLPFLLSSSFFAQPCLHCCLIRALFLALLCCHSQTFAWPCFLGHFLARLMHYECTSTGLTFVVAFLGHFASPYFLFCFIIVLVLALLFVVFLGLFATHYYKCCLQANFDRSYFLCCFSRALHLTLLPLLLWKRSSSDLRFFVVFLRHFVSPYFLCCFTSALRLALQFCGPFLKFIALPYFLCCFQVHFDRPYFLCCLFPTLGLTLLPRVFYKRTSSGFIFSVVFLGPFACLYCFCFTDAFRQRLLSLCLSRTLHLNLNLIYKCISSAFTFFVVFRGHFASPCFNCCFTGAFRLV